MSTAAPARFTDLIGIEVEDDEEKSFTVKFEESEHPRISDGTFTESGEATGSGESSKRDVGHSTRMDAPSPWPKPESVTEAISAGTKATRDDVAAGRVPFVSIGDPSKVSSLIVAQYQPDGTVQVFDSFFDLDAFGREGLLHHEFGHEVSMRALSGGTASDKTMDALRPFRDNPADGFYYDSHVSVEEHIANLYSEAMMSKRQPWEEEGGKYSVAFEHVLSVARQAGLPLPKWADRKRKDFDPNQPRNDQGEWESGGGGGSQISYEATPGRSTGILPGIHTAPYAQRQDYLTSVRSAMLDDYGHDELAEAAGIKGRSFDAPGFWQGDFNPGTQIDLAGEDRAAQRIKVERYAAALGAVLKQEAVAYHQPQHTDDPAEENAAEFRLGRPITKGEMGVFYESLKQALGRNTANSVALVPSATGLRVLNFSSRENPEFHSKVLEAWNRPSSDRTVTEIQDDMAYEPGPIYNALPDAKYYRFRSDGDLISNDWKADPNGEGYRRRFSAKDGPDLSRAVDRVRARIQEVNERYTRQYGWGRAKEAEVLVVKFDEDQERDAQGRWTDTGAGLDSAQDEALADDRERFNLWPADENQQSLLSIEIEGGAARRRDELEAMSPKERYAARSPAEVAAHDQQTKDFVNARQALSDRMAIERADFATERQRQDDLHMRAASDRKDLVAKLEDRERNVKEAYLASLPQAEQEAFRLALNAEASFSGDRNWQTEETVRSVHAAQKEAAKNDPIAQDLNARANAANDLAVASLSARDKAAAGEDRAIAKFEFERDILTQAQGADYWAVEMQNTPGLYNSTMHDIHEDWQHIGGTGPTRMKLAAQEAFGLEEGMAWDARQARAATIDTVESPGKTIMWAAALQLEYDNTQKAIDAGVEVPSGESAPDREEWYESSAYDQLRSEAEEAGWDSTDARDRVDLILDKDEDEVREWIDNNEKLVVDETHDKPDARDYIPLEKPDDWDQQVANEGRAEFDRQWETLREKISNSGSSTGILPRVREPNPNGEGERSRPITVADLQSRPEYNWDTTTPERRAHAIELAEQTLVERLRDEQVPDLMEYAEQDIEAVMARIPEEKRIDGGRDDGVDKYTEALDKWYDKAKRVYAEQDPDGKLRERWAEDFEYDDADDFNNWAGGQSGSVSMETVTRSDWPLTLYRGVGADTTNYVPNFAESWSRSESKAGEFGHRTMDREIPAEQVLVFQGAPDWKASDMGHKEQEFIVLSDLPKWYRKREERRKREAERARKGVMDAIRGKETVGRGDDHGTDTGERSGPEGTGKAAERGRAGAGDRNRWSEESPATLRRRVKDATWRRTVRRVHDPLIERYRAALAELLPSLAKLPRSRWRARAREVLAPLYREAFEEGARDMVAHSKSKLLRKAARTRPRRIDPGTVEATDFIDELNDRTDLFIETIFERLQSRLEKLEDEEDTEPSAAEVLEEMAEEGHIRTIALTEVSASISGAREWVLARTGLEQHEWVDSADERVRNNHSVYGDHGVVPIGFNYSKLTGGGTVLRWPLDPECDDPSEIVNCRCFPAPADEFEGDEDELNALLGDTGEEEEAA